MTPGKRLVGIHQSHYLPWLRYVEKVVRCDVFVVLDDIQYTKNGWQNRNKVKGPGGPVLLTVPVHAGLGARLCDVTINDAVPWRRKHWRTIEQAYARAPHFDAVAPFLKETYERAWTRLTELNDAMLDWVVELVKPETRVVRSSALDVPGEATTRLANLVKAVGGTHYYSGAFALDAYLDAGLLAREGIDLELQRWRTPEYPQQHGAFIPDLSILDLLMNRGPDALAVLRSGGSGGDPPE
jgi:hypothetical protein